MKKHLVAVVVALVFAALASSQAAPGITMEQAEALGHASTEGGKVWRHVEC